MKATFNVRSCSRESVTIVDLDGPMSVTNDAEAVVADLYDTYGNCRFYYYDTCDDLFELEHKNGIFTCFKFVSCSSR